MPRTSKAIPTDSREVVVFSPSQESEEESETAQHESVTKAGQVVAVESFSPKRKDGTNMPRNQVVVEDLVELIDEHGGILRSCASTQIVIFQ